MFPDIISVQFKQKCLSINSVKSLFQVHKTSKKIFVIFEKFINKGLECKYMITSSLPPFKPYLLWTYNIIIFKIFF